MEAEISAEQYINKEIELATPLVPALVSVVRLTVSGIASAIGFNIETIEDIKVAVSEVCNKLIINAQKSEDKFIIRFKVTTQKFIITFLSQQNNAMQINVFDEQDEFGIAIVNALVDEVTIYDAEDSGKIISLSVFLKEHKV